MGRSGTRHVSAYDIATVYAALSRTDDCLVWFERAIEKRVQLISFVARDPVYNGLCKARLSGSRL